MKLWKDAIKSGIKAFGFGPDSRNLDPVLNRYNMSPSYTQGTEGLIMHESEPLVQKTTFSDFLKAYDELPFMDEPISDFGYIFDKDEPLLEIKDFINKPRFNAYDAAEHTIYEIDNDLVGDKYFDFFLKGKSSLDVHEQIQQYLDTLKK